MVRHPSHDIHFEPVVARTGHDPRDKGRVTIAENGRELVSDVTMTDVLVMVEG